MLWPARQVNALAARLAALISAPMTKPRHPLLALSPALLASALLTLSACATPETQLRTGLVNAGLSKPMASCMAHPMSRELSLGQLMKLRSLSKVSQLDPRTTSYEQFLRSVRALQDPQILKVTASAALGCALG